MASSVAVSLEGVLKELGYNVRTPGQLKGRSGVLHYFTMYARRGRSKEIAIDVDNIGRPADVSILALYTKAFDTNLEQSILITNASLDTEAMRLARLYNVLVISSRIPPEDLRRQLRDSLSPNSGA